MSSLTISASPHITGKNSTQQIMLDVVIALMPCLIAAVYFFGWHVIVNAVVCVAACAGAELLYNLIMSKKWSKEGIRESSIWDLSCVVTGLLLALNIPSVIKLSAWDLNIYSGSAREVANIVFSFDTVILCIFASFFSMIIVKMLFGGIGKNFVNPALMGRIFLMVITGLAAVQAAGAGLGATTGATWLSSADKSNPGLLNMFLGNTGSAAVGETCAVAILIGGAYLSIKKVIDFRLPLIIIGVTAVFAFLFDGLIAQKLAGGALFANTLAHVLSGGLLLGAVFMATDYATSPNTFLGNVIYGIGIALITVLIRVFAGYPEGVSFAIVIMNITVPLIDKYIVPRPFGSEKTKKKKKEKKAGTVKEVGNG